MPFQRRQRNGRVDWYIHGDRRSPWAQAMGWTCPRASVTDIKLAGSSTIAAALRLPPPRWT